MWKRGKVWICKKDYRSKNVEKEKGTEDNPSTETKTSSEEGWVVYPVSTGYHSECDIWLIESGAPFYMTPHREWFYEYEKYNGGDDFPVSNI